MTGTGTSADPFIISTAADLQLMNDDLDAYYELAGNVDASGTATWNANAGFAPITTFTGQLDGKGYAVATLTIDRAATSIGLFHTNDGAVKNLGLTSVSMAGGQCGALAYKNTGTITNCYSTGTIVCTAQAGGLIEWNTGTADQCYSSVAVTSSGVGPGYAGGFVFWNNGGTITNSYARGAMTGDAGAGWAGGFCQSNDGTLDDCYSTGAITGFTTATGGFNQYNDGTITNCFWDTEASSEAASDGGTGKTTAEMKIHHTYLVASWNFKTIWKIDADVNNAYPSLGQITSIGARDVWLEGPYLCYYDDYGNKRKVEGLPAASGLPWWFFT